MILVAECTGCGVQLDGGMPCCAVPRTPRCAECRDGGNGGRIDPVIGGMSVQRDLLDDYVDKVRQTMRVVAMMRFLERPDYLARMLRAREEAHRRLLESVGLDYDSRDDKDVTRFNGFLDEHVSVHAGDGEMT